MGRPQTIGFLLGLALLALSACQRERNMYRADRVAPLLSFEIKDPRNEVLWKLWNRGGKTISKIRYAEVPDGFVQEIPAAPARPRAFRPGESLVVFLAFPDGWCRYAVTATGPDAYRDVSHECAQLTAR